MISRNIVDKLFGYFVSVLGMREYRRGWLKGDCPMCSRQDKFGVHLENNRVNCFVCGYKDRPIETVRKVQNFQTYPEAYNYLKVFEEYQYLFKSQSVDEKPVKLPTGFRSLALPEGRVGEAARAYVRGRGFDPDMLALKGYGYCGTGPKFGYLIMPFYRMGKLCYYHARSFLADGPRFDNPSFEEFGIGKSRMLYNFDSLFLYQKVYLVESVLNAETLGDTGIGTGGKFPSASQLSDIIKSPVLRVVVLLDPDAWSEAINVALKLIPHKEVKLVKLPDKKDVNDLGRLSTLRMVRNSSWLLYNNILSLKHDCDNGRFKNY